MELEKFLTDIDDMLATLQGALNGMLLLAIVAAALGVVNATVSSVIERRAELGLLRAVGSTRRQVVVVVMGEAGLLGLVGGILVNGGNMYGLIDLDLGDSLRQSLPTAVTTALVGLIAAPLITTAAAYWPAAYILRGTAVDSLKSPGAGNQGW
jgi:putative ABC transport system permease protein